MNRNPREKSIVTSILAWLKTTPNTWAMKTHGDERYSGLPDIIGCIDGTTFGIEVKQAGKTPTELQSAMLARMARAGAVVGVAHSKEEAQNILRPLLEKTLGIYR